MVVAFKFLDHCMFLMKNHFIVLHLDIHECKETPNLCGPNSNCTNKNGSYYCSCWIGYEATMANHPISDKNPCKGKHSNMNS